MTFVIVPAFNEQERIGRVIRDLFEHGYDKVVVVDDGSRDDTAKEAQSAGAIILQHVFNRGQGAALQTGNDYALMNGAQTVVHFDADGQFNPKDIAGALSKIKNEGFEVVLGSRFLDGRSQIPFFKKFFILPISRLINNFFTGLKLTDVHNGFRVMNREAVEKIKITQDGMAHNSQIPKLIKQHNLRYVEYPVEVTYHESGQGIIGGFKILYDLLLDKFSK